MKIDPEKIGIVARTAAYVLSDPAELSVELAAINGEEIVSARIELHL